MTIKIGPKGHVDLMASEVGPAKKVKIVAFNARSTVGPIAGQHFPYNASKSALTATIDMTTGKNATVDFRDTGSVIGNIHLTQWDTGVAATYDGHRMWAIITDTGVN